MMKITGLSHPFKWENLHNWWLTKYFFAPLCVYIYIYILGVAWYMFYCSFVGFDCFYCHHLYIALDKSIC